MKRFAGSVLGIIAGVAVLTGCNAAQIGKITEDSPEWDCGTMGNRICGPISIDQETKTLTDNMGIVWEYDMSQGYGETLCVSRFEEFGDEVTLLGCTKNWK
jgi:hypothetical protein